MSYKKKVCYKFAYKTKAEAKTAMKEHGYKIGCKQVYKCPYHKKDTWHLSSQED